MFKSLSNWSIHHKKYTWFGPDIVLPRKSCSLRSHPQGPWKPRKFHQQFMFRICFSNLWGWKGKFGVFSQGHVGKNYWNEDQHNLNISTLWHSGNQTIAIQNNPLDFPWRYQWSADPLSPTSGTNPKEKQNKTKTSTPIIFQKKYRDICWFKKGFSILCIGQFNWNPTITSNQQIMSCGAQPAPCGSFASPLGSGKWSSNSSIWSSRYAQSSYWIFEPLCNLKMVL